MPETFVCAECGKEHGDDEREIAFNRPDDFFYSPINVYKKSSATNNSAIIAGRRYFIRGVLPVKVHGSRFDYCFGLWAEVNKQTFERARRIHRPRDFVDGRMAWGRVANELTGLFSQRLKGRRVAIKFKKFSRPSFYLRFSGHSLQGEQLQGISLHRRDEINQLAFAKG